MTKPTDPRHTVEWQRIRRRVVAAARAANLPCAKCGRPIDYSASGRTQYGPSVDHQFALAIYGAGVALEESLLRIMHTKCNASLGGKLGRARQLGRAKPQGAITANRW
jgi:hypothetical protein